MIDTLQHDIAANVPDPSVRITVLVIVAVVVAITVLLVYFRMKEADEEAGL